MSILTNTKLGIGDFVLLKNKRSHKYLIVGEKDEKLFEVMQIRSGNFSKVLRRDCTRFEVGEDLNRKE